MNLITPENYFLKYWTKVAQFQVDRIRLSGFHQKKYWNVYRRCGMGRLVDSQKKKENHNIELHRTPGLHSTG